MIKECYVCYTYHSIYWLTSGSLNVTRVAKKICELVNKPMTRACMCVREGACLCVGAGIDPSQQTHYKPSHSHSE